MIFTYRHLPHWIPEETPIFVTWRLAGTLPLKDEALDRWRSGPLWLMDPRIAAVVANALLHGESVRKFYELYAWAVMPNHVHAIFQPLSPMPATMRWLKGRTSRMANQILGRKGKFWQEESFDHWVRSREELESLIDYVESNPVKAGIVDSKEQWQWSSAR